MGSVVCGRAVVFAAYVGKVDAELAAHDLVFVEVADGGGGGIGVGEFGEAEAFRSAGVLVVDEAEGDDGADGAADGDYLFFREAWDGGIA